MTVYVLSSLKLQFAFHSVNQGSADGWNWRTPRYPEIQNDGRSPSLEVREFLIQTLINRDFIFSFSIFSSFLNFSFQGSCPIIQIATIFSRPQWRKRGMVKEHASLYATTFPLDVPSRNSSHHVMSHHQLRHIEEKLYKEKVFVKVSNEY